MQSRAPLLRATHYQDWVYRDGDETKTKARLEPESRPRLKKKKKLTGQQASPIVDANTGQAITRSRPCKSGLQTNAQHLPEVMQV